MSPQLSVILPAYNEGDAIVGLIQDIQKALGGQSKEILLVDDSSPDGTAERVRQAFAGDPEVKVIVRTKERGLGFAIREGIEKSAGSIVVVMDSDGNHQPSYLPFLVGAAGTYDAAFGSRYLYGGRMSGFLHHHLSWAFNVFVRLMTGGSIIDYLYGYCAIRREVLFRCDFDRIFWGYGDYCIRFLYDLESHSASILQVPMINGDRRGGQSKTTPVTVFFQYAMATLSLAWTRKRLPGPWRAGVRA